MCPCVVLEMGRPSKASIAPFHWTFQDFVTFVRLTVIPVVTGRLKVASAFFTFEEFLL